MAITILRKTGFFGPRGTLSLLVDNEEITTIANEQTVTFELPVYPSYLTIKGDDRSSILVSDHQKYILCLHPTFMWIQILMVCLFVCSLWTTHSVLLWFIWGLLLLLALIALFLIPHFCFKPLIAPKIKIKEFC